MGGRGIREIKPAIRRELLGRPRVTFGDQHVADRLCDRATKLRRLISRFGLLFRDDLDDLSDLLNDVLLRLIDLVDLRITFSGNLAQG